MRNIALGLLLCCCTGLWAAPDIHYHIGWSQPNSHLLHVRVRVSGYPADSLQVSLPAWRPGRYVIQNYVKNLISFTAHSSDSVALSVRQIDKDTWRIYKTPEADVFIEYDYFARHLDGGSSYLDDSEAYINPITCCVYVDGHEMQPVTLSLRQPEGWRIAGALTRQANTRDYEFDNYHELVDTPIIMSPDFRRLSFEYKGAAFELVLQGEGNYKSDSLKQEVKKIVATQIDMMRDIPFKRYWFLYHLVSKPMGHGVEHKNSTSIVIGPTDFMDEKFHRGFLGVTSHEFYHVWNVERIRPAAMYYPDYSRENYTSDLWIYEGFTSYYGNLTLRRAQLIKKDRFFKDLANQIRRYERSYATKIVDVEAVSWNSWTKGYGQAPPNSFYSFYTKGSLLALLLDLNIRHMSKNKKSLDDVMRYLNLHYALTGQGVPDGDLQKAVAAVTGNDFKDFFAGYVFGTRPLDFDKVLGYAGLELHRDRQKRQAEVYLGVQTAVSGPQMVIRNVMPDSPAFEAGLDLDDVLLAIDGRQVHDNNVDLLLRNYSPGDTVVISVFHRDRLHQRQVVLKPALPTRYFIETKKNPGKLQRKILRDWLRLEDESGK